ncbi:hypothetical protein B9Z55_027804 [Caenorhabditis nigoni]|uniref:SPK domain-containing protein n=1 Tax=Caenorhabditis nigoni TaxID=1611254 RepID=A0A2G5SEI4_9PELO|nr:hypothetical protein B9Z55_027804 [Caenorhabditis nigoni]
MTTRNDECERAIRFMSSRIGHYTRPENLTKWCELAKTEAGYNKSADSFSWVIRKRLDRIEDLKGFTLMEKARLVFIFSRPVSPAFLKILKDAKCVVELSDSRRITYFCSQDGTCVLQSDQNNSDKYFKGKPYFHKNRRAVIEVRSSDSVQDPPDTSIEQSRIQNGPFNGRNNYDELDEQELEDVTALKHERSRKPEKRHQNSWSSNNAKRVKTEEWDQELFTASDAPEALNNSEEAKINVLLLANNIGITALYCDLEDVQKKASQAIEMIKMEEREMTLNVADFNICIDSMLRNIKRSRNRYSCQTEKSLPLKTIYRHIKLSLILPFGPEIAGEALKIVDKETEELGESHHEVGHS